MTDTLSSTFSSQGLRVCKVHFITMDSNKTIENQVSQCKILEDGYKSQYFNAKSVAYKAKAYQDPWS